MLPHVDTRPRHRNSHKADAERRFPQHLQWLRGRPCCLQARGGCGGRIEAAHVDRAGGKGLGLKVADYHAVPMCSTHHAEYHRVGAATFEFRHQVDLTSVADAYAARSPHRQLWQARA